MLVDFAAWVRANDRLGLEAAALASGIADAWISPDGRLLSGDDGRPLLDTQLDSGTSAPTAGGGTSPTSWSRTRTVRRPACLPTSSFPCFPA